VATCGGQIWGAGDPVHLSQDAYRDLAWAVCDEHAGDLASLSAASDDGRAASRCSAGTSGTSDR
jgi:hypothetical protein